MYAGFFSKLLYFLRHRNDFTGFEIPICANETIEVNLSRFDINEFTAAKVNYVQQDVFSLSAVFFIILEGRLRHFNIIRISHRHFLRQ